MPPPLYSSEGYYMKSEEIDHIVIVDQPQRNLEQEIINSIVAATGTPMTPNQIANLKQSLGLVVSKYQIEEDINNAELIDIQRDNAAVLRRFIDAKRIEGRSATSTYNYAHEMSKLFLSLNKSYKQITSDDVREYLAYRKDIGKLKTTTISNIRMYLMTFFKWCWREDLITKNPMDRIGVIKLEEKEIETYTEEEMEIIRCACKETRVRALVEVLAGSGMRVSELTNANRTDLNLNEGELKVIGKGGRERVCYLTPQAKLHLRWYLESRIDNNPALFVTTKKPYTRLTKNGVEYILKTTLKEAGIDNIKITPHKFRRTLASTMISKNCPMEYVQDTLGHVRGSAVTAKYYAKLDKGEAKRAHRIYH